MASVSFLLSTLVLCCFQAEFSQCYVCETLFTGCRIFRGKCSCGEARDCSNPFPYKFERECQDDKKGIDRICPKGQCRNNGTCCQIRTEFGKKTFKCECSATGFYGRKCEKRCPVLHPGDENYPAACIYKL